MLNDVGSDAFCYVVKVTWDLFWLLCCRFSAEQWKK